MPAFAIRFEPLADDLWWVPAQAGEANAGNRGQVVNLVLARHRGRLWLLGSGPSPAFARALRCAAWRRFGLDIRAVANPHARAEFVLGNAGLAGARVVAPAPVREAMRAQCPQCVQRLRERLGEAAIDLQAAPVRLPRALPTPRGRARAMDDPQRWGPFEWHLVRRADRSWTSAWRHADAGVTAAFGLLWFDGPPDGRDTEPAHLVRALASLLAAAPAGERFIGDTGPPADRGAAQRQLDYWRTLWRAAQQGVAAGATQAGEPAAEVAEAVEGADGWRDHERHRLNWQRAWRLAEDALFAAPAPR
ncbi:MAG: hypothetical protein HZC37_08450 [Burkholderiales bacterium]|nr:hypothetical protein [Burkholderiales bacterium]